MKRLGFLFLLGSWALWILDLPDIAEKVGKWVPILDWLSDSLTRTVEALVRALPPAPACGQCLAFYVFWPTLVFMALALVLSLVFYVAIRRLGWLERSGDYLTLGLGALLVVVLSQSWILYRYSGLSLGHSLSIVTFAGKVEAARDKNFFLHASNIYGVLILFSYFSIVVFVRWAWLYYNETVKKEDAKPS